MDKQGKYTGPGKVREQVERSSQVVLSADLFNYNTDGNMLKIEHKEWISAKLIPLLRQFRVHVQLVGMASQIGDRAYNRQLSLERVLRVKRFLAEQGVSESQIPGPDVKAAGEDLSTSRFKDDESDRAVRVNVALGIKPRPLFPTIVLDEIVIRPDPTIVLPPTIVVARRPRAAAGPRFSQEFEIKQLSDASVSVFKAIGGEAMFLLIRDVMNKEEIVCIAPGVGTGIGTPLSFTLEGPFNSFSTTTPQQLTDFEGRAIWQTLFTAGPVSKSRITFLDIPSGTSTKSVTVPMDTGLTFGAAAFAPTALRLICSNPKPF
jgi:hypothetical protein